MIQPFDLAAKFRAFGFEVQTIKGDDIAALLAAVAPARGGEQRPLAIVLDSISGRAWPIWKTCRTLTTCA